MVLWTLGPRPSDPQDLGCLGPNVQGLIMMEPFTFESLYYEPNQPLVLFVCSFINRFHHVSRQVAGSRGSLWPKLLQPEQLEIETNRRSHNWVIPVQTWRSVCTPQDSFDSWSHLWTLNLGDDGFLRTWVWKRQLPEHLPLSLPVCATLPPYLDLGTWTELTHWFTTQHMLLKGFQTNIKYFPAGGVGSWVNICRCAVQLQSW